MENSRLRAESRERPIHMLPRSVSYARRVNEPRGVKKEKKALFLSLQSG